jgi:hypothetical protein
MWSLTPYPRVRADLLFSAALHFSQTYDAGSYSSDKHIQDMFFLEYLLLQRVMHMTCDEDVCAAN